MSRAKIMIFFSHKSCHSWLNEKQTKRLNNLRKKCPISSSIFKHRRCLSSAGKRVDTCFNLLLLLYSSQQNEFFMNKKKRRNAFFSNWMVDFKGIISVKLNKKRQKKWSQNGKKRKISHAYFNAVFLRWHSLDKKSHYTCDFW